MLVNGLKQVFLAKILAVSDYGLYNYYNVAIGYSNYTDLGTNNAYLVRSAECIRRREAGGLIECKSNAENFTRLLSITYCLIGLVLVAFDILGNDVKEIYKIFFFSSGIGVVFNIQIVNLRLKEKFETIYKLQFLYAVIVGFAILVSFYCFRVTSALPYTYINVICYIPVCVVLYFYKNNGIKNLLSYRFEPKYIMSLIGFGIPLTIVPILYVMIQSLDKILYKDFYSGFEYGCYTFGAIIGQYFSAIPSTIAMRHSTSSMLTTGSFNNYKTIIKPVYLASKLTSLFIIVFGIAGPWLFGMFFQNFSEKFYQVYLIATSYALLFPIVILTPFLTANDRLYRLITIYCLVCAAYFVALQIAIIFNCFTLSYYICGFMALSLSGLVLLCVSKACEQDAALFSKELIRIFGPPIFSFIIISSFIRVWR